MDEIFIYGFFILWPFSIIIFLYIIYLSGTVDSTKDKLKKAEKTLKSISDQINGINNFQDKLYSISDEKADKKAFDDFWGRYLRETEELSLRYFNLEDSIIRYLMLFRDPAMSVEDIARVFHCSTQLVEYKIKLMNQNDEWS